MTIHSMSGGVMYRCCPGVYEPAEDTEMMLQAPEVMGGPILEVGCGTGVVSIYHALRGLSVTATDINPVAIECARRNAELNGVCIDLVLTDLFPDGRFRTVLFNPPLTCRQRSGNPPRSGTAAVTAWWSSGASWKGSLNTS
ncbi:methyltransferase [Thermogymnomonas acidicola]|uniref:methyltransferase n=1 Tax=Thermogymnomonas acidicola TaxID=399579 RepID=UPI00094668A0|nr:methyltransferase [Thermogymnomonas acidicola]